MTSSELAQRTGTDERYIREWLGNQGAGGYVEYDPARCGPGDFAAAIRHLGYGGTTP